MDNITSIIDFDHVDIDDTFEFFKLMDNVLSSPNFKVIDIISISFGTMPSSNFINGIGSVRMVQSYGVKYTEEISYTGMPTYITGTRYIYQSDKVWIELDHLYQSYRSRKRNKIIDSIIY